MTSGKDSSIRPFLSERGPFSPENYPEDTDLVEHLGEQKVLVIGAGGLGCEILKNLALSGVKDIHVIDLDTIDVSNLNRQFLFRKADVGKPKAQVAAEFINKRCKGVNVQHYQGKIQDYPPEWYKEFNIVIAGLDNVEARRWINKTLVDFVKFENGEIAWDSVIPLVDGGTEGFNGQSRLILPGFSSCFECSMASMAQDRGHFHICTIANVPRIPEHCIMFALQIQWPLLETFKSADEYTMVESRDPEKKEEKPSVTLDKDDVHHMTWLFKRAEERAKKYGITGVTYNLTMQVVKNIIPAIASTNALIAAECVNEVFKYLTFSAPRLDNYFLYLGAPATGINSETYVYRKNNDCAVCRPPRNLLVKPEDTLSQIMKIIQDKFGLIDIKSVAAEEKALYLKNLHSTYVDNLEVPPLVQGISEGAVFYVTDDRGKAERVAVRWTPEGVQDEPDEDGADDKTKKRQKT